MFHWKIPPQALLGPCRYVCVPSKSTNKMFWDNSCQIGGGKLQSDTKGDSGRQSVLGEPKHGVVCLYTGHVQNWSDEDKPCWWWYTCCHWRGWVFWLSGGVSLLLVNRWLEIWSAYILNNVIRRQEDCHEKMSESWCERTMIMQIKNVILPYPLVRSGQCLCWSQIFTDFTTFPAILLNLYVPLEAPLDAKS